MSCCPVAARAPVVVRAQAGARHRQEGGNKKMMASAALHGVATVVRRGWSSSSARGVTVAALASAGRPAAVLPSVVSSRAAAACAWGAAKDNRGYASNVFQSKNRLVLNKAVAEPSSSEAEVVEEEPIKLLTSDESEELLKIRHTTAHICAMATQKLFPDAQCTIGPW